MGVNKVVLGGETLVDLTADTVTADTLTEGVTAHSASGEEIVGTLSLEAGAYYATCATAAGTATKAATTTGGDFVLEAGAAVTVQFTYACTASAPTLNVDGTGAAAIKMYGTTAPSTYMWQAGAVVAFVYNGSYWLMVNGTQATTTYYGVTKLSSSTSSTSTTLAATASAVKAAYDLASNTADDLASHTHNYYGTCVTSAGTAAKVVTMVDSNFTLATGSSIFVRFSYTNTASAPTLNVGGTGAVAIKMYSTAAPSTYMWQAGAVVAFVYNGSYWLMVNGTQATTTYYGLTKLSSSTNSTSTTLAATPSAVKAAYDLANTTSTLVGGRMFAQGTATISYTSYPTSVSVSFGRTFTSVPAVITSQVFAATNITVYTDDITTTGFTARLSGGFAESGTRSFQWIAIG